MYIHFISKTWLWNKIMEHFEKDNYIKSYMYNDFIDKIWLWREILSEQLEQRNNKLEKALFMI